MDCSTFTSLARIQVLLLPVGTIDHRSYDKWATQIRKFTEVRLSDVQGDSKDDLHRFMPKPLESGFLFLSFSSHPPPPSQTNLSLFRPSSSPLGVIGIATSSQSDALSSIYAQFNALTSDLFPHGSVFPLARSCFVFEEGDGSTNLNVGDHLPGLVVIPSMMGNKELYLGTLVSELCSNILSGFSILVKVVETQQGTEALNAGLFGSIPNFVAARRLAEVNSDLPNLISQHSFPNPSTNSSAMQPIDPSRLPLKRTSTTGPVISVSSNRSSLAMSATKKRQSTLPPATSHARLYKFLGDLFLLAGRMMDASIWYNEAIALFRQPVDTAWQASSLEGLATTIVIETWTSTHSLTTGAAISGEGWAAITEKLSQATTLYSKVAVTADGGDVFLEVSYLFVAAVCRHVVLLHKAFSARGWNASALSSLVLRSEIEVSSTSTIPRIEAESSQDDGRNIAPTRSDVSNLLAQAHGPWLLHLASRDRIDVLNFMARLYSSLSYRRKEAYILRELVSCLMDLIVHGREERKSSRSLPDETKARRNGYSEAPDGGQVGRRETVDENGNDSVIQLMKYICKVHGVALDAVHFADEPETQESSTPAWAHFGWPELQIGIVREALAVAEGLPDYSRVALFALSAVKQLRPFLDPEDQYNFHTTASRAIATIRRRGDERRLAYWLGDHIIVNIKLIGLHEMRLPVERPWRDMQSIRISTPGEIISRAVTPSNSKRATSAKATKLAVQNETIEFIVTLENPYSFALELIGLSLSTRGVPFQHDGRPVIIPADAFQQISLSGKATEAGTLVVQGCVVHLQGSEPFEIQLPMLSEDEEQQQQSKSIALGHEAERSKAVHLNHRWSMGSTRTSSVTESKPETRFLELKIVPNQPLLRLRRSSLTNGAVMLYTGETSNIRITLENISNVPIDYLNLIFDDSTKSDEELELAEGELDVFLAYELEHSLVKKPVLSWDVQSQRRRLLPGKEMTLDVRCFGKPGCTKASIQFSYAHTDVLGKAASEAVFYTRQLTFPLLVTVYEMLECHGMNILPLSALSSDILSGNDNAGELLELLRHRDAVNDCVLTLDVQNTYGLAFEVELTCGEGAGASRIIPPGSTYRLILPIERFSLSESMTSGAIPSLRGRQFIVSTGDTAVQRELFWYREELFKKVRVNWKEAGGSRRGELSLRQLRFTLPMLNALRIDQVEVSLSLTGMEEDGQEEANATFTSTKSSYLVKPNKFVVLEAEVKNRSPTPLLMLLSLEAEPSDHVLHEGVLKNIPIGRLDCQSSTSTAIPMIFVAEGKFSITAQVRIADAAGNKERAYGGKSEMTVNVEER